MNIQENISLKNYNTFGIDVKAKYFAELQSKEDIQQIINNKIFTDNKYLILGGGSNILFTKDFDGIVLNINYKGIEIIKENNEKVFINVNAGEIWDDFVDYSINHNYYGLENLSGIPGNVGSSPVQNIGAYGVELKDVLYQLEAISIKTGKTIIFSNKECEFDYRSSVFKNKLKNQYLILSVQFRLSKLPHFNLEYADLKKELSVRNLQNTELSSKLIREIIIRTRQSKLPKPSELGNAGSFFKNPVINEALYNKIKIEFPDIKYFVLPDNMYKIPAAWLIEQCGWKSKKFGNAGVYSNQPLIIVNQGNATGAEIFELSLKIQNSVYERFGIPLESEVNII